MNKAVNQLLQGEWRRVGDLDTTGGPPTSLVTSSGGSGAGMEKAPGSPGSPGGMGGLNSMSLTQNSTSVEMSPDKPMRGETVFKSVENTKWCQNPQYHLEILDHYSREDVFLKVVLRRTDKPTEEKKRGKEQRSHHSLITSVVTMILMLTQASLHSLCNHHLFLTLIIILSSPSSLYRHHHRPTTRDDHGSSRVQSRCPGGLRGAEEREEGASAERHGAIHCQ